MRLSTAWLSRRGDAVSVIGAALLAKATGCGHRPIAAALGRPVSTVRGWLRRFGVLAEVELVFDPFDLTRIQVRYQGRGMGAAIGHQIGRHVHPGAKPETSPDPAPDTGIDYLALVRDRHTAAMKVTPPVNYADLTGPNQKPAKTVGTVDITGIEAGGGGGLEVGLEAKLASFATLLPTSRQTPNPADVIPGQLDLLQQLNPDDDSLEHS